MWDLSLVDPDNRRPISFERFNSGIGNAVEGDARLAQVTKLMRDWKSGEVKLDLIRRALAMRSRFLPIFQEGSYEPMTASGARGELVLAFARVTDKGRMVVVVPRLTSRKSKTLALPVGAFWGDTKLSLPGGTRWRNLLTDEIVEGGSLAAVLAVYPAALLADESALAGY